MAIEIENTWTQLVSHASSYGSYTITYKLYAMYIATSITGNTHTIKLKWTTTKTAGGTGVYDNDACTPSVSNISNGNPSSWTGSAFTITKGSSTSETDQTTSGNIIVTHSSNGTYSATWSWSLSHVYAGGGKSGTVAVTLPTIPRASSFSLSSNNIETNDTVTATITRADSTFTHNITTTYNSTSYTLASGVGTSANITIPTGIRSAMKSANAKTATLTLTLTTLSGSTSIGTATTTLTITAPTATIAMSASSVAMPGTIGWTLSNYDTSACTYVVTRKYSSTTVRYPTSGSNTSTSVTNQANTGFWSVLANVSSATVTATVTTYVGSTTVGTATATYKITVPTATYYWSVSNGSTTYQGSKLTGKSIAGLEYVTQTFTCTNNGSGNTSTVASYNVTCSKSDISLTVTKSSNTITVRTGVLPASASSYTFTLTCTIADSRGTTKSVTTSAITATGYQKPKVSGSISRVNSAGNADSTGTYAKVSATATPTTATMTSLKITQGSNEVASGTTSASAAHYGGNYNVTQSYNFTVTAVDSFGGQTVMTLQLPVASYEFNLYPGGGAAFGMVATANEINSAHPMLRVNSTSTINQIISGSSASNKNNSVSAWALSGRIYLVASGTATGNKALTAMNNAGTTNDILRVNQGNQLVLPRSTIVQNEFIINSAAQTPGIYYRPTNTSDDSDVMYPGRIYYQTSISGYEGRFMFREYSPTSADPTKYVAHYEYFGLPAPDKDRTTDKVYYILTDKNLVTEAQGGTGQSSLDDVTVGVAKAWTIVSTNPSSGSWYAIPFVTGSGNQEGKVNNGVRVYTREGTASQDGYAGAVFGNGTNIGTAGNKWGFLRFYPHTGNYYMQLQSVSTLNANRTIQFPDFSGTVALRDVTVTGTLTKGSWINLTYPTGYTKDNCHVTGWDVDYNGNYRTGDGLESSAGASRVMVSLEASNIKAYTNSTTYDGKSIRVFLSLNA